MGINFRDWKKIITLAALLSAVFIFAVAFWYAPILFKGYPAESLTGRVVLSYNYAATDKYAMENRLNVTLSPELVSSQALESAEGNKFGAVSFAAIFKIFGRLSWNNLILASICIYALSAVIFTLAVYLLFGPLAAVLFSAIFILLPFNGSTARIVDCYEFSLLYFSVFVLCYFAGRSKKYSQYYLVMSGIFLSLACLSREAFFIFLPVFFLWQLWNKNKKELLAVFIPVILIIGIFWLPSIVGFGSQNNYSKMFFNSGEAENNWTDYSIYGHVFPDPYTFHFENQSVIDKINADLNEKNGSWLYKINRLKVSGDFGARKISLIDRFIIGSNNLLTHFAGYFDIGFIGGPIIFILMLMGLWELKKRDAAMANLFIFWFAGSLVIWSFIVLVIRNHLMDSGWMIALLAALALAGLPKLLADYFGQKKYVRTTAAIIIFIVMYGLILGNHAALRGAFDGDFNLGLQYLSQKVIEKNVASTDVIAIGSYNSYSAVNYLSGKSVVYFAPETVARLAQANKLQEAFDKFGAKYYLGYDGPTALIIASSSAAENIANWPALEQIHKPTDFNQNWLMNIIK